MSYYEVVDGKFVCPDCRIILEQIEMDHVNGSYIPMFADHDCKWEEVNV